MKRLSNLTKRGLLAMFIGSAIIFPLWRIIPDLDIDTKIILIIIGYSFVSLLIDLILNVFEVFSGPESKEYEDYKNSSKYAYKAMELENGSYNQLRQKIVTEFKNSDHYIDLVNKASKYETYQYRNMDKATRKMSELDDDETAVKFFKWYGKHRKLAYNNMLQIDKKLIDIVSEYDKLERERAIRDRMGVNIHHTSQYSPNHLLPKSQQDIFETDTTIGKFIKWYADSVYRDNMDMSEVNLVLMKLSHAYDYQYQREQEAKQNDKEVEQVEPVSPVEDYDNQRYEMDKEMFDKILELIRKDEELENSVKAENERYEKEQAELYDDSWSDF